MTNFFADRSVVAGANDGSSWDVNAWNTADATKNAIEKSTYTNGDKAWVRRTTNWDIADGGTAADISPTDDGGISGMIYIIGWPRAAIPNTTITQADWTNGSTKVDNVVGITPSFRGHCTRWATAPDGKKYLITAILWEAGVDGMGAGDEFTVGARATNTTKAPDRYGKIYGFTDNLDTTGVIQYTRDSALTWVEDDNITDAGAAGGSAEINSGGETAVGFIIDRPYIGSTVTGVNGLFQIDEDEDYATRPDVGGLRAAWDADSHDLPMIDFNDADYQLMFSADLFFSFRNFMVMDSTDSNGPLSLASDGCELIGIIVRQTTQSDPIFVLSNTVKLDRFIIEGSGLATLTLQRGLSLSGFSSFNISNGAIYNCGDNGIYISGSGNTKRPVNNVNIGVEIANSDFDINITGSGIILRGRDIKMNGTVGYVSLSTTYPNNYVQIENYQKELGVHKTWYTGGSYERKAVGDTPANKKLSDYVLEITPNANLLPTLEWQKSRIFEGEFELDAGAHTLKFWIFNDSNQTLNTAATDDLYLKVTYVDTYSEATEYIQAVAYSTQTGIVTAANADDWDYLEASFTLAVASKVRCEMIIHFYDVDDVLVIDPYPVIT